jgi:GNAT superfamily N-acetyltransferase
MPDLTTVARTLRTDPVWSAYALGDLDERRARHCEWVVHGESLALLYREFGAPILFAMGDPGILDALPPIDSCHLQIPEAFLPTLEQRLTVRWTCLMHRMALDPGAFVDVRADVTPEPLDARHEDELRALFADGRERGEDPDFFIASQLSDEAFFGVREHGRLIAAGGTHLYSASESVATIGNVYTHSAHRGRGLASAVTAAVVRTLLARGTETIALNVKSANAAAIAVYERLGFRFHARFYEGQAGA